MRGIRTDVRIIDLILRPDDKVLVMTDTSHKAGWLFDKFLDSGMASKATRAMRRVTLTNDSEFRFLVVNPNPFRGGIYELAGMTATKIFYDDFAGYTELYMTRFRTMLRQRDYGGEYVLAPFNFEELQ